jgi:hypothetical protein
MTYCRARKDQFRQTIMKIWMYSKCGTSRNNRDVPLSPSLSVGWQQGLGHESRPCASSRSICRLSLSAVFVGILPGASCYLCRRYEQKERCEGVNRFAMMCVPHVFWVCSGLLVAIGNLTWQRSNEVPWVMEPNDKSFGMYHSWK